MSYVYISMVIEFIIYKSENKKTGSLSSLLNLLNYIQNKQTYETSSNHVKNDCRVYICMPHNACRWQEIFTLSEKTPFFLQ